MGHTNVPFIEIQIVNVCIHIVPKRNNVVMEVQNFFD